MRRVARHVLPARGASTDATSSSAKGPRQTLRHSLRSAAPWVVAFVVAAGFAWDPAAAGQPRDYARLLVQGKVTRSTRYEPLSGLRVVLKGQTESFEALTDRAGVFVFERVPVATYDLEIVAPDGRVIRRARNVTSGDSPTKLLEVGLGRGDSTPVRIVPDSTGVAVDVPEPPPNWGRVGGQGLIFVGIAALLVVLL